MRMKPFQKHGRHESKQGVVSSKRLDERSYQVETATNTYRRNRVHLRRSTEQPHAGTEQEAPADDHTDSTNRSMYIDNLICFTVTMIGTTGNRLRILKGHCI